MRRVILNDVLLREAAQVAGATMTPQDQLTYVKYLLEGHIDRIEIGFPASSAEQLARCQSIVRFVRNWEEEGDYKPLLSGLARAREEDIKAVKEASCDICHIYIPASDNLMSKQFDAKKYGDTQEGKREWAVNQAVKMVEFARSLGFAHIEYSPEDAARTDFDYLCRIVSEVIKAGANIINIPDTTGLRIGQEFGSLIHNLIDKVDYFGGKCCSEEQGVIISVHCHNDSDHATHNALQAILGGATQVEGTFYGLGERSGMTKFESVLMNIDARGDVFNDIKVDFKRSSCVKIVNFVANALGMPVPRHWPVVGTQNKICSSGTHQAIEIKAREQGRGSAYYSWNPDKYGHEEVEIAINSSSGRLGLDWRLKQLGYELRSDQVDAVYEQMKKVSEAKRDSVVTDRELTAIVQNVITRIPYQIVVKRCQAIGGEGTIPTATAEVEVNGKSIIVAEIGDGPYDAIMKAVKKGASHFYPALDSVEIILDDWRPVPVTKGAESLADVYARIRVKNGGDAVFAGRAVHLDTNQASAQAFANCFSWYLASLNK